MWGIILGGIIGGAQRGKMGIDRILWFLYINNWEWIIRSQKGRKALFCFREQL